MKNTDHNKKNALKQCQMCGYNTLPKDSIFEICDICGWQDDWLQNERHDYAGGANRLSFNEYRKKWLVEHHKE